MGNLPERERGEGKKGRDWGAVGGRHGEGEGGRRGCAMGTQPCCSSVGLVFCVLYVREGRKEKGEEKKEGKEKKKEKNMENFPNLKISKK
jgi:hypothetical protein